MPRSSITSIMRKQHAELTVALVRLGNAHRPALVEALRDDNWNAWCGDDAAWFADFFIHQYFFHLDRYTAHSTDGIMRGSDGTTHQLIGLAKADPDFGTRVTLAVGEDRRAIINKYLTELAERVEMYDKVTIPFTVHEEAGSKKRKGKGKEVEEGNKSAPKPKKPKVGASTPALSSASSVSSTPRAGPSTKTNEQTTAEETKNTTVTTDEKVKAPPKPNDSNRPKVSATPKSAKPRPAAVPEPNIVESKSSNPAKPKSSSAGEPTPPTEPQSPAKTVPPAKPKSPAKPRGRPVNKSQTAEPKAFKPKPIKPKPATPPVSQPVPFTTTGTVAPTAYVSIGINTDGGLEPPAIQYRPPEDVNDLVVNNASGFCESLASTLGDVEDEGPATHNTAEPNTSAMDEIGTRENAVGGSGVCESLASTLGDEDEAIFTDDLGEVSTPGTETTATDEVVTNGTEVEQAVSVANGAVVAYQVPAVDVSTVKTG